MHSLVKASAVALCATTAIPSVPRDGASTVAAGPHSIVSSGSGETAKADGRARLAAAADLVLPDSVRSLPPSAPGIRPPDASGAGPAQTAASAGAPPPAPSTGLEVEKGDRLRIGFFETIDLGAAAEAGRGRAEPEGGLRTFYQRMDLSGEYTVEGGGALSIPLLGLVRAAGRDIDDIRLDLAAAFAAVVGRSARIDARIVERAPVYVVGPVRTPGAVRYASGMFVLQAMALAGGLERIGDGRTVRLEGARELERLRVATLQIDRLTARRARLETQRGAPARSASSSAPAMRAILIASEAQVSPTPPSDADSVAAAEAAILQGEQARRRLRQEDLARRVEAARSEVEAIGSKLDQFEIEKAMRAERLDAMQKLRDRGVDTSDHVLTLFPAPWPRFSSSSPRSGRSRTGSRPSAAPCSSGAARIIRWRSKAR